MGKKKAARPLVTSEETPSNSDDEDVPTQTQQVSSSAAPTSVSEGNTSVTFAEPTLWVEVCKSDKKKVTTYCRGLAAHGHKLPATAAQLKKMVGPADVLKDESDCLEFQGDVVEKLRDVLVSKLSVPADLITDDKAAAMAKAAKSAAKVAAACEGAGATSSSGAAIEDDSDADEDVTITRKTAVEVAYCPVCTFPAEMCEYSGAFEKCKPWLMEQLAAEEAALLADAEEKGRKRRILTEQERVDKLLSGTGKKKVDQVIVLDRKTVRGKKRITTITGLDLFTINMTDASREFKKIFSCGAGVVEEVGVLPLIEVQGDVVTQLIELLPTKYPQISVEQIYVMEGKKRVCATEL